MTVQEARKIMGEKAKKYTDEEMEEIICSLTAIADIAIDDIMAKRLK